MLLAQELQRELWLKPIKPTGPKPLQPCRERRATGALISSVYLSTTRKNCAARLDASCTVQSGPPPARSIRVP